MTGTEPTEQRQRSSCGKQRQISIKYLCRLGFGIHFVHGLGTGIDCMGKFLFHVLV